MGRAGSGSASSQYAGSTLAVDGDDEEDASARMEALSGRGGVRPPVVSAGGLLDATGIRAGERDEGDPEEQRGRAGQRAGGGVDDPGRGGRRPGVVRGPGLGVAGVVPPASAGAAAGSRGGGGMGARGGARSAGGASSAGDRSTLGARTEGSRSAAGTHARESRQGNGMESRQGKGGSRDSREVGGISSPAAGSRREAASVGSVPRAGAGTSDGGEDVEGEVADDASHVEVASVVARPPSPSLRQMPGAAGRGGQGSAREEDAQDGDDDDKNEGGVDLDPAGIAGGGGRMRGIKWDSA